MVSAYHLRGRGTPFHDPHFWGFGGAFVDALAEPLREPCGPFAARKGLVSRAFVVQAALQVRRPPGKASLREPFLAERVVGDLGLQI